MNKLFRLFIKVVTTVLSVCNLLFVLPIMYLLGMLYVVYGSITGDSFMDLFKRLNSIIKNELIDIWIQSLKKFWVL